MLEDLLVYISESLEALCGERIDRFSTIYGKGAVIESVVAVSALASIEDWLVARLEKEVDVFEILMETDLESVTVMDLARMCTQGYQDKADGTRSF